MYNKAPCLVLGAAIVIIYGCVPGTKADTEGLKVKYNDRQNIQWRELESNKSRVFKQMIKKYFNDNDPEVDSPNEVWTKFEQFCITTAKLELGIKEHSNNLQISLSNSENNTSQRHLYNYTPIKDKEGKLLTSDDTVCERWREYYLELFNKEFPRQKEIEEPKLNVPVDEISTTEVGNAIKKYLKKNKGVGPDQIPVMFWIHMGTEGEEWLTKLFKNIFKSKRMPESWRRGFLIPIYKNKDDVHECGNYRGIRSLPHTLKIYESTINNRIRKLINITDNQFGTIPGKSVNGALSIVKSVIKSAEQKQQKLWMGFIDIEKAYDRIPRPLIWQALRAQKIPEHYIDVIMDMYKDIKTYIVCPGRLSESIDINVGIHQGSALSPLIFVIVMNYLTEDIQKPLPWNVIYVDDVILMSTDQQEIQNTLDQWINRMENNGLPISRTKTKYMICDFEHANGEISNGLTIGSHKLERVDTYKYLGWIISSNGTVYQKRRVVEH